MNESFGDMVCRLRKQKGWTVKKFIERLGSIVSPTYVTKIEAYGEIPSPELICKIAEVFDHDKKKFLECAKKEKIERFKKTLDSKYQKAVCLYRLYKRVSLLEVKLTGEDKSNDE